MSPDELWLVVAAVLFAVGGVLSVVWKEFVHALVCAGLACVAVSLLP